MNYPTTHSSLLERVQEGDEISWNEFYYRYAPVIRSAGSGAGFSETECDDLLQAVMFKFFNAAKTFVYRKGEVRFRTFFAAVVRSQIVDMIRRSAKQKNLPGEVQENSEPFDRLFMEEWRKAVIEEAKAELRMQVSPQTYQAYELYVLQERPAAKVAEILGMTTEEIYAVKHRCTKMMKKIITRHNRADEELKLEL